MKKLVMIILALMGLMFFVGCNNKANVVSHNLSKEADQFRIPREIVFYNGITGENMLEIVGYCSLGNFDSSDELSVTCKVGDDKYVKHYLGLSDNVTYFARQLLPAQVSAQHYKVIFKPKVLIPNVEVDK